MQGARFSHRAVLCGLLGGVPLACQSKVETLPEEQPDLAHREEPCTEWCSLLFDGECRPGDPAIIGDDKDECIESCMSSDPLFTPQADSTDACFDEVVATFDCVKALSCEDQRAYFAASPRRTHPGCGALTQARLDCNAAH